MTNTNTADPIQAVGFGYCQQASVETLNELLTTLEQQYGPVSILAACQSKSTLVNELAQLRGYAFEIIADQQLQHVPTVTQSLRSINRFGTGSVAEACALLGAGSGAQLLQPRLIADNHFATAAIASLKREL